MVPKTERFELRLDPALLDKLDVWRGRQSDLPSRAEGIRRLVERGLADTGESSFRPTKSERLTLWLLTEMLKDKGGDSKRTADLIQSAIYGGHYWGLDWEMSGVMHSHSDNPKAVSEVLDILDMWSFIESSFEKLETPEKTRILAETGPLGKNPKFHGFDGNHETEHLGIARFLVEELKRFESFKGRDFNSHAPTVGRYKRMANAFEAIRPLLTGRLLSSDEIITLLSAGVPKTPG